MTRSLLLLAATVSLIACSGGDVAESIDEADRVVVISEDAEPVVLSGDPDYLNDARDPEGNNLMGEPGDESEATAESSTHNEPGTTADNMDVINQDADPDD